MTRTKSNKMLSETVAMRRSTGEKYNPFEVHFNRDKRRVLGERIRGDRGRPGFSKAKAMKLRKRTLLKELCSRHKNNEFLDRRIAESSAHLSHDDRMSQRFTAERRKQSRKDVFNLDETTELTHMGMTIESLDKYEDPRSDDEDDTTLSADFVKKAHFGGGLLTKSDQPSAANVQKEWVEQMINESKKRKHDARRSREETHILTEQLDEQYRQLSSAVLNTAQHKNSEISDCPADGKKRIDQSDNESSPSVNTAVLPTEICELEIRNDTDSAGKTSDVPYDGQDHTINSHREFIESVSNVNSVGTVAATLESVNATTMTLANDYDKLLKELVFSKRTPAGDRVGEKRESESTEIESQKLKQLTLLRVERMNQSVHSSAVSQHDDDDDNDAAGATHDSADLLLSRKSGELGLKKEKSALQLVGDRLMLISGTTDKSAVCDDDDDVVKCHQSLTQDAGEAAVGDCDSVVKFRSRLIGLSSVQQLSHVQQLISEAGGRRPVLSRIYGLLVEYLLSARFYRVDTTSALRSLDVFTPLLFDLTARIDSMDAANAWRTQISRQLEVFMKKRHYPGLPTLMTFRLTTLLFPPSDRRHAVALPVVLFMAHVLNTCSITCRRHVCAALFICSLIVECTELSKRIVPEMVCCFEGLLYSAILPAQMNTGDNIRQKLTHLLKLPFTGSDCGSQLLALSKKCGDLEVDDRGLSLLELSSSCSDAAEDDDEFRVRSMRVLLVLVVRVTRRYQQLPAAMEMFHSLEQIISALPISWYPDEVRRLIAEFGQLMAEIRMAGKTTISREQRKPRALPLYEPAIDDNFTGVRRRAAASGSLSQQKSAVDQHKRLLRGYKRQLRSTVREVRRDTALIARQRLNDTMIADRERQKKVKRLMSALGNQEGEFRKVQRMKR